MIFKPKMCNLDLFLMFLVIFTLGQCCCWCAPRESSPMATICSGIYIYSSNKGSHIVRFGHNFHAETISGKKSRNKINVRTRQDWLAERQFAQLPHVSWSCHPFGYSSCSCSYSLAPVLLQTKVYGYKWSPHFLTASSLAFSYESQAKNNNFSADVIFISTYVKRSRVKAHDRPRMRGTLQFEAYKYCSRLDYT